MSESSEHLYSLLVVDDDPVTRRAIEILLASSDSPLVMDSAADREEMYEKLTLRSYDILLLDYLLQDTDGLQLLTELIELGIDAPIVLFTGRGNEELAVAALKNGAYDYVSKEVLHSPETEGLLIAALVNARKRFEDERARRRSEIALRKSEERYRALIENSPILILRFFPDDWIVSFVNDGYCRFFKTKREDVLGSDLLLFIPEEYHNAFHRTVEGLSRETQYYMLETSFQLQGETYWVQWYIQALWGAAGEVSEYQAMGQDITMQKQNEQMVQQQSQYLQAILDAQNNIILVARGNQILQCNKAALRFYGLESVGVFLREYPKVSDILTDLDGGFFDDADLNVDTLSRQIIEEGRPVSLTGPEEKGWFILHLNRIDEERGCILELSNVTDIEEQRQDNEKAASVDSLTGLNNRRSGTRIMEEVFSGHDTQPVALIYFDIDYFKTINDSFGHETGDAVLRQLSALLRPSDEEKILLSRWGGEEFLAMIKDTTEAEARGMAEQWRKSIEKTPFPGIERVTCSFGVTLRVENEPLDTAIARADRALNHAKEHGRNRVTLIRKKG